MVKQTLVDAYARIADAIPVYLIHNSADAGDDTFLIDFERFSREAQVCAKRMVLTRL